MTKARELTGQKFGRLTVVSRLPNNKHHCTVWLCRCECKQLTEVSARSLISGQTKSCGCYKRETASATGKKRRTHGMRNTVTYNSWSGMKARCSNPKTPAYKYYGGRGIKVCKRWNDSFEAFHKDMGERPEGLSLGRIDNNADYQPDNCFWSTPKEQANNRSNNRVFEHEGVSMNMSRWANRLRINPSALHLRLSRWDVHEALTRPPKPDYEK